jgi:hypothetical protein
VLVKFYFPGGFSIEFVDYKNGAVTHFLFRAESDTKFVRTTRANR